MKRGDIGFVSQEPGDSSDSMTMCMQHDGINRCQQRRSCHEPARSQDLKVADSSVHRDHHPVALRSPVRFTIPAIGTLHLDRSVDTVHYIHPNTGTCPRTREGNPAAVSKSLSLFMKSINPSSYSSIWDRHNPVMCLFPERLKTTPSAQDKTARCMEDGK